MNFKAHIMGKKQQLIAVHYQLGSGRLNYLKNLQEGWTFLDSSSDEIYNLIIGNIKKTLLIYLLAKKGRFIAPVIVFIIKSCFFTGVNHYSLKWKSHISQFFSFFCGKMIRVICIILVVAIKDFKLRLNNKNFPMGKSIV